MSRHSIKKNPSNPNGLFYRIFKNKVVEAKLTGPSCFLAFENYLDRVCSEASFIRPAYGTSNLAESYYGKAYCNLDHGDTFDVEEGKKIARNRCLNLFHADFDAMTIQLLEELHSIECRIFNGLRKNGKLDVYNKARSVEEIYNTSVRMPDQKEFREYFN